MSSHPPAAGAYTNIRILYTLYLQLVSFQFIPNLPGWRMKRFLIFWCLNSLSQKLSDQVMELREQIKSLSNLNSITDQSKSKAVQLLNTFHSFNCCGFMTLERPILTLILITVVTYTIILFKFKESN